MSADKFMGDLSKACSRLMEWDRRDVLLVFHDDADGISSGAVAYEALRRKGFNVKLVCIEKLMDQVIGFIHEKYAGNVIMYVDIGSPHADKISKANAGRSLTIILDHHDPVPASDPLVYNLNPEFYGMEGERDASGSVVTYFFAKALDPSNIDLSSIALIGVHEIPGEITGLNLKAREDAEKSGRSMDTKKMFRLLQILGPVGYYNNGPFLGVKACLEGLSDDIVKFVEELEDRRKKANRRMLAILYRRGLNKTRYIQWFDTYNVYRGMGTKVVGTFCSFLSFQGRLVDPDKYILGFMTMPNEIPGLMELKGSWVKLSMRAPRKLRDRIEAGSYPGISEIVVNVAHEVGGIGDGHKYAASAVIPTGAKEEFLEIANSLIKAKIS
ncbi:MAG: hypothetical protein DRJ32_06890 [Thermoprotei archaeon]|mgnify:CR=1 FL=1|nr:MAG: hypothetical protein DRJ32_06890 [Thermoprotei archaeon]